MSSYTKTSPRRRSRARTRGAVTLEAVIVALFLVLLFTSVVALGGLYKAKLRAMHESRFRNTLNATNSCEIAGPSLVAFAFPELEGHPATPADPVQGLRDIARLSVPGMGGGVSRARTESSFPFFGVNRPVSGASVTACNPKAISFGPVTLLEKVGLRDEVDEAIRDVLSAH